MRVKELAEAVKAIHATMDSNRDYLIELDQQNGDGDLGVSMANGFEAIAAYLADTNEADLGRALLRCSSLFNETAPSTLGTIVSFGLMGMAKSLKGKQDAALADFAQALDAGVALIMERAHSKEGEKTILDALVPAVQALKDDQSGGSSAVLARAAAAAAQGSEATRTMKSVHGRAAYYGDASVGVIDGGSVVGKLIFGSLASWASESKEVH
ncbi:MAG: dihydroxyacetone kinase subunit L [Rectinema sp.]